MRLPILAEKALREMTILHTFIYLFVYDRPSRSAAAPLTPLASESIGVITKKIRTILT